MPLVRTKVIDFCQLNDLSASITGLDSPIDIIIAFDTTEGRQQQDSSRAKEFLKNLLLSYNTSSSKTNVGLVTYGNTAEETMPIILKPNREALLRSVGTIQNEPGPRMVSRALDLARTSLNNFPSAAGKENVSRQIVLISLGENDPSDKNNVNIVTKLLERDGIKLIVLAVNAGPDTEYGNIVKDRKDLISIPSSNQLKRVLGTAEERSGEAAG